jgi:hypothetical protein
MFQAPKHQAASFRIRLFMGKLNTSPFRLREPHSVAGAIGVLDDMIHDAKSILFEQYPIFRCGQTGMIQGFPAV